MKDAQHEATLVIDCASALSRAIAAALAPEAEQAEVPKTRGRIEAVASGVRIDIAAADLPSLRASVNSHLRWVDAAMRAASLAE